MAPAAAAPDPGHDWALADLGCVTGPLAEDGQDRLPLRGQLVAVERREDHGADGALCFEPAWALRRSPSHTGRTANPRRDVARQAIMRVPVYTRLLRESRR